MMKQSKIEQEKPGLKMKELVEATGLTKSTLLYYLSLGLIPEPVKTSTNMSYYDPESIERIKFIQIMKNRHRLSLSEIHKLLEEWGDKVPISTHLELTELVFGPSKGEKLLNKNAFLEVTGLSDTQLEGLLEVRLLIPLAKECFDREDVIMGKVLAQGLSWGYRIEDLTFYVSTGEQIVDREFAMRKVMTGSLSVSEDAAMTLDMVKSARVSRAYVTDRLFQCRVAEMKGLKDEKKEEVP